MRIPLLWALMAATAAGDDLAGLDEPRRPEPEPLPPADPDEVQRLATEGTEARIWRYLHTHRTSRAQHGPGHLWCAMALPRQWEHGDGRVAKAAPALADLEAIKRGEISPDDYRVLCVDRFAVFAESGSYAVGKLRAVVPAAKTADARAACRAVGDGDTLFCACPRPDRPRRYPFCHLELLAPFLAAAGWTVVLYGKPFNPDPKE